MLARAKGPVVPGEAVGSTGGARSDTPKGRMKKRAACGMTRSVQLATTTNGKLEIRQSNAKGEASRCHTMLPCRIPCGGHMAAYRICITMKVCGDSNFSVSMLMHTRCRSLVFVRLVSSAFF